MVLTGQDFLNVLHDEGVATVSMISDATGASKTAVMWRGRELVNDGAVGVKKLSQAVVYLSPAVTDAVEGDTCYPSEFVERDIIRVRGKMKQVMDAVHQLPGEFTARDVLESDGVDVSKTRALSNLEKLYERELVWVKRGEGKYGADLWLKAGIDEVIESSTIRTTSFRSEWDKVREDVLDRDDNSCVECGSGGEMHVHHDPPVSELPRGGGVLDKSNLHSYCEGCHQELGEWGN